MVHGRGEGRERYLRHQKVGAYLIGGACVLATCGCSTVSVVGPVSSSSAYPVATLSTTAVGFDDTALGATSASRTVTLSNTGSASLTITGFSVSDPGSFPVTSTCGASLQPGAQCSYTLAFHPSATDRSNATLTIADNSGGNSATQQLVSLSGSGVAKQAPQAVLSSPSLDFPGSITSKTYSADLTLSNPGNATLSISQIAISGPKANSYSVARETCGTHLLAGATCTVTVTYAPTLASTADLAYLTFTDDAGGTAGTTQSATLSGVALARVDSVTNFGASIACGYYAEPHDGVGPVYSTQGFAGLFQKYVGARSSDRCRAGDQAADFSRVWAFYETPRVDGNQLYTVLVGSNDASHCQTDVCQAAYGREMGAALAWLALPSTDKVLGQTITQRLGAWVNDTGFGLVSSSTGASLTFPVNQTSNGANLYVVYHVYGSAADHGGAAAISVDGNAPVNVSSNSGLSWPTPNGTADSYFLQTIPLSGAGQHTIKFQSVGAAGTTVGLVWAGVPQRKYVSGDGAPRVLVGSITNSPSPDQTRATLPYNVKLRELITQLSADGMNITLVPTDTVLDPSADFTDLLHPNTGGHWKLANAFEKFR